MQEVAKKIEELKRRCYQEELLKRNEDWNNSLRSMIRNREQSLFFYDPDLPSSYDGFTFLIKLLLPRVQESPAAKSREHMSIPGNVFYCQHARRDPDELHNDSRNLATSLANLRTEGIDNSGSEEPLQPLHFPCSSGKAEEKSLDDKISLMSMTHTMPWVLELVLKA